jgi:hypothetical protein
LGAGPLEVQVSFETGETIYTALNPATGQGYASVELYTNTIDPEDKATLIRLYNDFKLSGVGRTSFFSTGWYKLTDLDMGDMPGPSLQETADPCTEAFPGVDCDEFGRISHLQVRAQEKIARATHRPPCCMQPTTWQATRASLYVSTLP